MLTSFNLRLIIERKLHLFILRYSNVFTDLATIGTQAICSNGFAPNQDSVLSNSIRRIQQRLHTERHCLHTIPVPVPLKQGTIQRRDDHLIAKHLQGPTWSFDCFSVKQSDAK